jgi:uncharacterized SAM-binding protein YcdF (DUF218 family)
MISVSKAHKRIILTVLLVLLSLVFLLGFTKIPWIISKPLMIPENIAVSPVIVVLYSGLGNTVRNGLDKYSLERIQKAVHLWKMGLAPYILFTGGSADRRENGLPGSRSMAIEAINQGIPREKIIIEQGSKDTRHNASNSCRIIKARNWNSLILVTNDFHMQRAARLFEKEDIKVYPAPVEWRIKGKWKSNWDYLRFIRYEFQARLANLLLNDEQIDSIIDLLRPN